MTPGERRERIEQYQKGPLRLRNALNSVPDEAVRWRPGPGKWSVHEVVCHCADSETNAYTRFRMLVAEKEPLIVGYDQDHWARVFDYHSLPLEPSLHVIDSVRSATSEVMKRLPDEAWSRKGRHTESGEYTLENWLRIYADHLEGHARQIERNLEAWETGGGQRTL
jgi:hypothetical protein